MTGRLPVRFFHFNRSQQAQFDANPRVRCFGRIRKGPRGLEMIHPQYDRNPKASLPDTLTPVYSVVEGLGQAKMQSLVRQALAIPGLEARLNHS